MTLKTPLSILGIILGNLLFLVVGFVLITRLGMALFPHVPITTTKSIMGMHLLLPLVQTTYNIVRGLQQGDSGLKWLYFSLAVMIFLVGTPLGLLYAVGQA